MALQLSPDNNVNMKSWSLGRKSSKKDKKRSPESSPRPKSLIMNMPSASSGAELSSSVQASPSLTYSTSPRSRQSSLENELNSSPSASKYLSTTQLKDKVRRLKSSATPSTSRPPLTAKNNVQNVATNVNENGDVARVRTTSLPSLIKSPIAAAPSPSAPLLSPAAAVIGGRPSMDDQEGDPFIDRTTSESTPHPSPPSLSPTPQQEPLQPLLSSQSDHACEVPTTSQAEQLPTNSKVDEVTSPSKSKASDASPKEGESSQHPTAVASLRRFKGVDGFGSLDRVKHARFDSMTVKESEEKEVAKSQPSTPSINKEQQKYSFAIRKSRPGTNTRAHQKALTRRNPRKVEAKYDVAIETQRVLSWSFGQAKPGQVVVHQRRLVAMPIPSLLGCDRAASWTVERISRLTSCLIHAFGS